MYNDEFELTFDLEDAEPKAERRPTLPQPEERVETVQAAPPEPEVPEPPVPEAAAKPVPPPEEKPVPMANGRTVLISGGDRGIGAAAARAFYAAG